MEEHIASGQVPKLGQGLVYICLENQPSVLKKAYWSITQQLKNVWQVESMLQAFELPEIKQNIMH